MKPWDVVYIDESHKGCLPRLCGGLIEACGCGCKAMPSFELSPPLMRGPH